MFKEWSSSLHHSGVFIPRAKLDTLVNNAPDPGYASVYWFSEKPESPVGLDQYAVSADCVILDLDHGISELAEAEKILNRLGLAYEVWSSGGKGFHVIIPHEMITSKDLPHSHYAWVLDHGLPHDRTLYQHGRILALPGRIHPKTRNRKSLLKRVEGKPAEISLRSKESLGIVETRITDEGALKYVVMRLSSILINGPSKGDRHKALWTLAKDMRRAGWSYDTALDVLLSVNDSWTNPKTEIEVIKAVRSSYK